MEKEKPSMVLLWIFSVPFKIQLKILMSLVWIPNDPFYEQPILKFWSYVNQLCALWFQVNTNKAMLLEKTNKALQPSSAVVGDWTGS